jgi:hypothetical protein
LFLLLLPNFVTYVHSSHNLYIIIVFFLLLSLSLFLSLSSHFFTRRSFISIGNRHRWHLCGFTAVSMRKKGQVPLNLSEILN